MKVDNVLILAAGKGTRMGQIGQVLPKVIWPIFNKSILELEISYAKKFNPNKIFINLYNSKDKILEFSKSRAIFDDAEFIIENEALDIGGAVHNLAEKLNYEGNLLILNSDQFIVLSKDKLKEFENKANNNDATLLTFSVDPKDVYGGLNIENERATSLIPKIDAAKRDTLVTYTGMSLIKLNKLKRKSGKSSFFDSVIDFKHNSAATVNVDTCEYWDFGTLKRYKESIKKIKSSKDEFINFLKESEVSLKINLNEIDDNIKLDQDSIIYMD